MDVRNDKSADISLVNFREYFALDLVLFIKSRFFFKLMSDFPMNLSMFMFSSSKIVDKKNLIIHLWINIADNVIKL